MSIYFEPLTYEVYKIDESLNITRNYTIAEKGALIVHISGGSGIFKYTIYSRCKSLKKLLDEYQNFGIFNQKEISAK